MVSTFRLKALLIHLGFSALLIAAVTAVALFIWFPYPWYEIDGTLTALIIVFCVDVVVGPILTFVVSNNQKSPRELLLDFSLILVLQLAALVFGISEIYKQRVSAIVYLEGQFHLIAQSKLPADREEADLPSYQGVQYGMLRYKMFAGLDQQGIDRKMHSPAEYELLTSRELELYKFPDSKVPSALLGKHGDSVTYRKVAGKNKNGVVVIDKFMQIVDIGLMED